MQIITSISSGQLLHCLPFNALRIPTESTLPDDLNHSVVCCPSSREAASTYNSWLLPHVDINNIQISTVLGQH